MKRAAAIVTVIATAAMASGKPTGIVFEIYAPSREAEFALEVLQRDGGVIWRKESALLQFADGGRSSIRATGWSDAELPALARIVAHGQVCVSKVGPNTRLIGSVSNGGKCRLTTLGEARAAKAAAKDEFLRNYTKPAVDTSSPVGDFPPYSPPAVHPVIE